MSRKGKPTIKNIQAVVILAAALALVGCNKPPALVPVSGTVTLDGNPLPNAEVRFIPIWDDLDGNYIASGITDDEGKYVLRLPGQTESGACACENRVTVFEGPIPDEIRDSKNEQVAATRFLESLPNRPIPKDYTRVADTPLKVTVSADQSVYDLDMKRK